MVDVNAGGLTTGTGSLKEVELKRDEPHEGSKDLQANVEMMKHLYAAWGAGDYDEVLRNTSDKFIGMNHCYPGYPLVPFAGEFPGKKGIMEFFNALQSPLSSVSGIGEEIYPLNKNQVVVLFRGILGSKVVKDLPPWTDWWMIHINTFTEDHKYLHYRCVDDQGSALAYLNGKWVPPSISGDTDKAAHGGVNTAPASAPAAASRPAPLPWLRGDSTVVKELDPNRLVEATVAAYTAWSKKEWDKLMSIFSEETVIHSSYPGIKQVPWQGEWRGVAGVTEWLKALQEETRITGSIENITVLPSNRVLVVFKPIVKGVKSGRVMSDGLAVHIHTYDENYKMIFFKDFYDVATARAVIDGTYGDMPADK